MACIQWSECQPTMEKYIQHISELYKYINNKKCEKLNKSLWWTLHSFYLKTHLCTEQLFKINELQEIPGQFL